MTDRLIDRDHAIDRMRDGLPVETFYVSWQSEAGCDGWKPTRWVDFDVTPEPEFRIPPEPRRKAREWRISQNEYHDIC